MDHNADIALRNEGQKWFTWFSKECRNLNRLSAQLVKLQALLSEGHKVIYLFIYLSIFNNNINNKNFSSFFKSNHTIQSPITISNN